MGSNVEDQVLRMQFDNSQFEKNCAQSMSTLDKLKQSLNFKGSSEGLNNLSAKMKGLPVSALDGAVGTVARRFSAMEIAGVTALANITNSVVNTGKQMLNSLTIAPIKQGFEEYELKLGSVQTIMNSTGASLSEVNGYLDELNTYADKTIYSFSDMTNNIGKFTNAGVKLKDAVAAIQGISNEAAVSGANAQQASHAMYNFAQALSAGYVKLIDWKSIENAQMATVEFKKELLKTAEATGTVVKVDGKYKTLTTDMKGKVSDLFDETSAFNESLAHQWMTTEVLTKTLARYADENTKIGKKAFAAAQEVKTFTQLMDTLKEAVGSGWARSFEILIGDFNEAKELWTSVNNVLSPFIDKTSDARNLMLSTWSNLGGREALIKGLTRAFEGVTSVVKQLKAAIDSTFKPLRGYLAGKELINFTNKFSELSLKFRDFVRINSGSFFDIFKGMASAVKIVTDAAKALYDNALKPIFDTLGVNEFIPQLIEDLAELGRKITEFEQSNKVIKTTVDMSKSLTKIWNVLKDTIVGALTAISNGLSVFSSSTKKSLEDVHDKVKEVTGFKMEVQSGFTVLTSLMSVLNGLAAAATWAFTNFSKFANAIGEFAADHMNTEVFSELLSILNNLSIAKVFDAMGKGGVASVFDPIFGGVKNIATSFSEVLGAATETLETMQTKVKAEMVDQIANALLKLAAATFLLASVDVKGLSRASAALGALVFTLTKALGSLGVMETAMGKNKGAGGILGGLLGASGGAMTSIMLLNGMAAALVQLSGALFLLSKADPEGLVAGLAALQGLVHLLVRMVTVLDAAALASLGPSIAAITTMAKALRSLAISLLILSMIEPSQLAAEVVAIGALSKVLVGFITALNPKDAAVLDMVASSIVTLGLALMELAVAMKILSTLSLGGLGKALAGIAGSLGILIAALFTMKKLKLTKKDFGPAATAILIMASALLVLSVAMKIISTMSWEELAKGLVGLAGALGMLVAALIVMSTFGGSMVAAASAIAIMAVALNLLIPALIVLGTLPFAVIASGLLGMGIALGILIAAGYAASAVAAPLMALAVSMLMMSGSVFLLAAGITLLAAQIGVIATVATAFATAIVNFVVTIAKAAPKIFDSLLKIVTGFLKALRDNIPEIIKLICELLIEIMDALKEQVPDVVESAVELVIAVVDGTAEAIEKNQDEILDAIEHIITAVFKLLGGLGERLYDKINEVTDGGLDAIMERVADFIVAGEDVVKGIIEGIKNKIEAAKNGIAKVANAIKNTFKKIFGIHSPSRVMKKMAGYIIDGFNIGLKDNESKAVAQTSKTFGKVLNTITKKLKYGRGAFKAFVNTYAEGVTGAKNLKNAIKTAGYALDAYALKLYKNSDAYKEDKDAIKAASKEIKKYRKELKKARSSGKKNVKNAKKNLKDAKQAYKDAVDGVSKHIREGVQNVKDGIAESVKAFVDPLSISISNTIFDDPTATIEDIQTYSEEVDNLTKQLEDLQEQYASMDEPNSRAGLALLTQIDEVSTKLEEAKEKLANTNAIDPATLLENMSKSYKTNKTFQDNLETLAKMGLSPELISYLQSQGKDAMDKVISFMRMTPEQIKEANEYYKKSVETDASAWLAQYSAKSGDAEKWGKDMTALGLRGANDALMSALGEMGPASQQYVDMLLAMSDEEFKKFKTTYKNNLKMDDNVAHEVVASYMMAGLNASEAFAKGLTSGLSESKKAAKTISNKTLKTIEKYLGIKVSSSSKKKKKTKNKSKSKSYKAGEIFVNEFASGVSNGDKELTKVASDTFGNALESIDDSILVNDYEPTIKPVVDMTDIQNAEKETNDLINSLDSANSLVVSGNLASDISKSFNGQSSTQATMNDLMSELVKLNSVIGAVMSEDRITQTNEFNIQGDNPEEIANEVNRILQSQLERRNAVWA